MTEAEYWSLQHGMSKLMKSKILKAKSESEKGYGVHSNESIYIEGMKDGIIAVKAMLSEKFWKENS